MQFLHFGVLAAVAWSGALLAAPDYFAPQHRLPGIGVDRAEITPAVLDQRISRMVQSQTFAIMREPEAIAGADRVTSPRLAKIFRRAAEASGLSASLIAAVAYLESWGDAAAVSPAGPKGIMQFSEATAREAGLRVVRVTRFKTISERKLVRNKSGRPVYRNVRRKIPYTVTVRDDRLNPERAVPAAARYLARLQDKFGGLDWAIFAYHCGEGCISELLPLAEAADSQKRQPSVAGMFFAANPARHRDLYEALQRHMQRDYSPTYWFRIQRAEQLLDLYGSDPDAFRELADQYRNPINPKRRANDRLVVWLKDEESFYRSADDLKAASGKALARMLNDPQLFGVSLPSGPEELYLQNSPPAIGTLLYLAFETHRLFDALKPKGERFVPLQIVELVSTTDRPAEAGTQLVDPEFPEHATGQVFDIDRSNLPRGERECLNFALDDMGWDGHLGFIQVTGDTLHIGSSPSSREFFDMVFQEASDAELHAGVSEQRPRARATESLR
ncbi:MAG TPA: transglycosylase SLT domain-containing protein [Bryobacteraceae bacterium]|nr:transglycosylase SLT domain-containing protein [Bryobacteraceae bacterium]